MAWVRGGLVIVKLLSLHWVVEMCGATAISACISAPKGFIVENATASTCCRDGQCAVCCPVLTGEGSLRLQSANWEQCIRTCLETPSCVGFEFLAKDRSCSFIGNASCLQENPLAPVAENIAVWQHNGSAGVEGTVEENGMGVVGWIIGLLIYLIGRTSMSFGANLQRYSMRTEEQKAPADRRPKKKQPLLKLGIIAYTGSGIFLSVALIFANPTLLAPCGTIIFVSNCFFAHWMNKEPFDLLHDGSCIFFIVLGTLMVVFSAPKVNAKFTNCELIEMCKEPPFILFLASVLFLVVLCASLPRLATANNAGSSLSAVYDEEDSTSPPPQEESTSRKGIKLLVVNVSYGCLAGALGGLNITLTKSIFSLIIGELEADGIGGALTSPLLWFIGLVLGTTFILQMACTTIGLERTPAMIFVPTQSVTEEGIAVLGGLFYFQDFRHFTPSTSAVFIIGEMSTISACIVLTRLQLSRSTRNVNVAPVVPKGGAVTRPVPTELAWAEK